MKKTILYILFLILGIQLTWGSDILNLTTEKELENKWSRTTDYSYSFSPQPVGNLTFQDKKGRLGTGNVEVYITTEDNKEYRICSNSPSTSWDSRTVNNVWNSCYEQPLITWQKVELSKRTKFKKIRFHATGTLAKSIKSVKLTMGYYFETDNSTTQEIAQCNVYETKTLTAPIILFHSDLKKIPTITKTDATGYFSYSITPTLTTSNCSAGKFGSFNLQVSYLPQTSGNHTCRLTLSDGTKSLTFTINASARKVDRNLMWTVSDKLNVGIDPTIVYANDVANASYTIGSQSYGPWYGDHITYTSDNSDVIKIEGNNLCAIKEGTATITATMEATESYNSLTSTKTITVTSKMLQTISWPQTFRYVYPDEVGTTIDLTATASSGLPITYSISGDGSIASLSGTTLTIKGKGRVIITATQVGNDSYEPAEMTKTVNVRDPNDGCDEYVLDDPTLYKVLTEINSFTGTQQEYVINGPADELTFKAEMVAYKLVIEYVGGNSFVDAYYDGDWHQVYECSPAVKKNEFTEYKVKIPRNSTKIRLATHTGALGYKFYKDVSVTQATYVESESASLYAEGITGVSKRLYLYINYSNTPDQIEILSDDERYVKPVTEPFGEGCGDYGRQLVAIDVTIPPSWTGKTYMLTFRGGDQANQQVQVPVVLKSTGRGPQSIDWTQFPAITTASTLTTDQLGASAKPSNLPITYTVDDPSIAYIDGDKLIINQAGTITITANQDGNDYYEAATPVSHTFVITVADLTFDNFEGDKQWSNPRNWLPTRTTIPNAISYATLNEDVEINCNAFAKRLTMNNHSAQIGANASLQAETIIGASDAVLFNLDGGSQTKAAATLTTLTNGVKAKVEIFVHASTQGTNSTWQYIGVPFAITSTPAFYGAWMCEWAEATGSWSYKKTGEMLYPWVGYCITQPAENQMYGYEIEGNIQTQNHTFELTRTNGSAFFGNNIVTNSYTAPIDITKLEASDFKNVEKTIYIYNTGSYQQWASHNGTTVKNDALAGQYFAIPALEADYSPYDLTVIPPMQAFCLQAMGENATFTVDYSRAVYGSSTKSTPLRAPRRNAPAYSDDENIIIDIQGSRFADAMAVLKRSDCTNEFDNGHDAFKWDGNALAPQIYSIEENKSIYSVDARPNLEGHYIGLKPGEDKFYTLTFRLVETDDFYYLKDLTDNAYYPIVEGTSIEIEATSTLNKRFQIVSEIEYIENQSQQGVVTDLCKNNQMAFLTNESDESVEGIIFDISGKIVERLTVAPHSTLNYEFSNLPHGAYIINLGAQNLKITK